MTVQECINYIDSVEPNAYTETQKAGWLSECEGKVYTSLFLVQPYEFTPITAVDSRVLALPAPYDRMYPRYLQAMIHYANGEYDRYANSMAVFNEVWAEANRWFGGDYDVTDRLRNRRFQETYEIGLEAYTPLKVPEGCAVVAGRIVVKKAYSHECTLTFSFDGSEVATVNVAQTGATPLPLLQGGTGGSILTDTAVDIPSGVWPTGGEMFITGRMLVPDEKWSYDPAYAWRRDARWHG